MAADLALQCASVHPDAAQDGLRAMLAGAKRECPAACDTQAGDDSSSKPDLREMLLAFADGCAKHDVSLLRNQHFRFDVIYAATSSSML